MDEKEINSKLEFSGFSLEAKFVPLSQSRNAGQKVPTINWIVTLKFGNRDVITTDYQQGIAHCPAYKKYPNSTRWKYERRLAVAVEAERGLIVDRVSPNGTVWTSTKPLAPPSIADVMYALISDADAINYSGFADWAENYGYNPDSISDKTVYDDCMGIALNMHNALPDKVMSDVIAIFENY